MNFSKLYIYSLYFIFYNSYVEIGLFNQIFKLKIDKKFPTFNEKYNTKIKIILTIKYIYINIFIYILYH